jgi:hypothetical protein
VGYRPPTVTSGAPHIVPIGKHHLRTVVLDFVEHDHAERNHQGLGNVSPIDDDLRPRGRSSRKPGFTPGLPDLHRRDDRSAHHLRSLFIVVMAGLDALVG